MPTLPNRLKLKSLILSDSDLSGASLATRIVVGRVRIEVRKKADLLDAKIDELLSYARDNDFAANDLSRI